MTAASDLNRDFYDQSLPGRDDYWKKMAAPRARVETILSILENARPSRVVDLGSGGGQLLGEIAARTASRTPAVALAGVDIASTQLAENARRYPRIAWHQRDLDVPMQATDDLRGTFDVVIASEIIEHVDRPEVFLENARSLATARTGMLILSTQSGPVRETEQRVGHRRHWSRSEMDRSLRRAGWAPERVWNTGFPFHDLSKWYANLNPTRSMDRFAAKAYGLREDAICFLLRSAFRLNLRHHGAQLFAIARRADAP